MKKLNRLQQILMTIIIILVILGCILTGLRQNTLTNPGYSAWTYIKYGLIDYPLTSLGNVFSDFANLWHVHEDNQYLSEELAKQRSYQTLYEEERNKNKELESLLEMKNTLGNAKAISATVLERSSENWLQTITISAGKAQGVKENMLVTTSEGAVGLVESVQSATSIVRLLTSQELINDIAIKMSLEDGSTVEGVLESYDTHKRAYRVSLFDNNATVASGQTVATSGKGGNYPSGIFVGTVTEVLINDDAIISTVYVKPVNNLQSFSSVLVLGSSDLS